MTTIVNFIEGNFIANPQEKDVEKPFWVLDSSNEEISHRLIVQSLIARCKTDRKPLIHIDLGLSSLARYGEKLSETKGDSGVVYLKELPEVPYYLVKSGVKDRKKPAFLTTLLNNINQDVEIAGKLREDKAKCSHSNYEFGLLVEGFEAWSLLNHNQHHYQKDVEGFISKLITTSNRIRQIAIVTWSHLLSEEINFHLERSSTCLTKILSLNGSEWKCQSTVRRYNGYSNEEVYSLQILEPGRAKVLKKKKEKVEERSKDQIEMVNSLGFTVEKDEASRQQQKQLKQLIFPHLKMRQVAENEPKCTAKSDCKSNCKCEEQKLQNLIILDDEQEDEDDIDV